MYELAMTVRPCRDVAAGRDSGGRRGWTVGRLYFFAEAEEFDRNPGAEGRKIQAGLSLAAAQLRQVVGT